jgi:phage minor structural protein
LIFVLDKYENIVATLNNDSPEACPYYADVMTERLDDAYLSYEFYVPADHPDANNLKEDSYVLRKGLDDYLLLFQITRIEEERTETGLFRYVYAEYGWEELNKVIIRPGSFLGRTAAAAMNDALIDSRWQVGTVEWFGTADFDFDNHVTSLAFLHEIKDTFGGELHFRVEMHNGKVSARYVDLLVQRGQDNGKTFTYEKDLVGVKRISDRSTVCTALIGIGKGDSSGESIDFSDISRSKASGDAFDKPIGQDWVGDPEALERWGNGAKHLFGVFEYDTQQPKVLLDRTWARLQEIKNGLLNYEVDVALLENVPGYEHEKVRIGDTVLVQDLAFVPALTVDARILEMQRSFVDPSADKVVLGQFVPVSSNADAALLKLQSTLLKNEVFWSEQGEKISKGTLAPSSPAVDDLWLDTNQAPNILKRWDGTVWVKATPTAANEIKYSDTNTVESLKPAQAGADVTSQNTAADTASVNGVPAETVEQNASNSVQKGTAYTNGWNFDDTNGVTITRSDDLVRVVESATDGIKIQKRATPDDPWVDQFYVDTNGNLKIVGDLVGGSINVDTDVFVGNNVYLKFDFATRFEDRGIIFYDPALGGGFDTRIIGTYLKMDLISDLITLYGDGFDVMSGLTRFWDGTDVYFNGNEPRQSTSENGFCGVGATTSSNTTSAFAGTGVNFRTKKSYTPSSVTLTATSNTAPGLIADIRADGFWIYVEGGNFTGAYRYWRGTYTA